MTEDGATILQLSDEVSCRFTGSNVEFGPGIHPSGEALPAPACFKSFEAEPCTLDFVKSVVTSLPVASAADFGDYIEFGLDSRFNLGMRVGGFHLVSTENPMAQHGL